MFRPSMLAIFNPQIYHLHIALANTWNIMWPHIRNTIEDKLRREIKTKYKTLDSKFHKLTCSNEAIRYILPYNSSQVETCLQQVSNPPTRLPRNYERSLGPLPRI